MPTEFFTDPNKDTFDKRSVSRAIAIFKERAGWHADIGTFVSKIKDDYDSFPEGADELARVLSVAQVLARSDTDDSEACAEAAFAGQLIAMQLLNYAASESAPVTHIAKPYLERQIIQYMNSQEVGYANHLVEQLHADLSTRKEDLIVPEDQEAFIMELSDGLYPGPEHTNKAEFASMGFRLILSEAYRAQADSPKSVDLEKLHSTPTSISAPALDGYETAMEDFADLESNKVKFDYEEVVELFHKQKNVFKGLDSIDPSQAEGIYRHIENEINQRNAIKRWLTPHQTIQINGNVFALQAEPGMQPPEYVDANTDILGSFGGFIVVTAPSNDAVLRHRPGGRPDQENTQWTVAIRINDPLFIHYGLDGYDTHDERFDRFERSEDRTGQTLDIPLCYVGLGVSTFKNA